MTRPTRGNGIITREMLREFEEDFSSNPTHRLAMNAVTRGNLQEIALNRNVLNDVNFCFSHEVETAEVTDQKQSSTCWLFAELNWLRTITQKKKRMKSFEFSENHVMFWDKLEKANYFLEKILALRDRDRDDRHVHFLLHDPAREGGEWHLLANIIDKYGLIPKSAMADTFNRENSRYMNERLSHKLREGAALIRKMHREGKKTAEMRKAKEAIMNDIYRILAISMGEPPQRFNWSYRDKKKKFHRERNITPKRFYEKYVGLKTRDVYMLMHCPMEDMPYYKTCTVEFFNNFMESKDGIYLNVPMEELKKCAVKVLKNGEACLFSCDVRLDSHTKEGILYSNLYDYDLVYNTKFDLDKKARLETGHAISTHCMVLTGVDLVRGKPLKWKVENSWGDQVGKKGYFMMSDEWFDEHTFSIVVHRKYVPKKLRALFKLKPRVLPPWHPMG